MAMMGEIEKTFGEIMPGVKVAFENPGEGKAAGEGMETEVKEPEQRLLGGPKDGEILHGLAGMDIILFEKAGDGAYTGAVYLPPGKPGMARYVRDGKDKFKFDGHVAKPKKG